MRPVFFSRRADRVNLATIIFVVVLLCGQVAVTQGLEESIIPFIAGLAVILLSAVNYFLPINPNLRGILFALLTGITVTALFFADGYNLNKHYMMLTSVAMITLYFKKELILIHGAFLNIAYIAMFIIAPENLMGPDADMKGIITVVTLINGILVLLYFLTRWGNELVDKTARKEEESAELVKKLNITFETIKEGTNSLDGNVGVINNKMSVIGDASSGILDSVQQIAAAIQEEASSVNLINESMGNSMQEVSNTVMISKGLMEKSNLMSNRVEDGWNQIRMVTEHMGTLQSTIGLTSDTVLDLKENLARISDLLNGIKDIAGQTNLLALNASIESARAGEQGKGFAVVAEQIRRLSEQSKGIVLNINEMTEGIFEKSEEAVQKSAEGEKAAEEGIAIINDISAYFGELKDFYKDTNNEMQTSMKEIETALERFAEIQEQIINVASISEENSASTQEILSYIEDENSQITFMKETVEQIGHLSNKLKSLAAGGAN